MDVVEACIALGSYFLAKPGKSNENSDEIGGGNSFLGA